MNLAAGTRLGPYEVVAPIGAGGMGEVYKARDTRLDRTVAIKVLPAALAADSQFRERFDREARAISQLTHPHICTLHDVGDADGTAFLVMEMLEGESLAARVEKGALPLDQALKTAIEIASALDAAHRAGIVHRDLKPGNVMLTRSGAKLLTSASPKPLLQRSRRAGFRRCRPRRPRSRQREPSSARSSTCRLSRSRASTLMRARTSSPSAASCTRYSRARRRLRARHARACWGDPEGRAAAGLSAARRSWFDRLTTSGHARPHRQDVSCKRAGRSLAIGARPDARAAMDRRRQRVERGGTSVSRRRRHSGSTPSRRTWPFRRTAHTSPSSDRARSRCSCAAWIETM